MDKEIKSIFESLPLAIEKEIKSQLNSAIAEIEVEHSYISLHKKYYEKKLKKLSRNTKTA